MGGALGAGSLGLSRLFRRPPTTSPNTTSGPRIETRSYLTNVDGAASNRALGNFDPGTGFSGAFDTTSGQLVALPSGATTLSGGVTASNIVDQFGGHRAASSALTALNGSARSDHLGFVARALDDGTLEMLWRSGQLDRRFPNNAVPESLRPGIVAAIQEATGRVVSSQ